MRSLVASVAIAALVLCGVAHPASAQTIARVDIVMPVSPGDTNTHVDLIKGSTATLTAHVYNPNGLPIANAVVKWSSGNAAIASVSTKGILTGKARGYATITASAGGIKATTRACVANSLRDTVPTTVTRVDLLLPSGTHTVGDSFPAVAKVTHGIKGVTQWGPCLHWSADSATVPGVMVDRGGVLYVPGWANPLAGTVPPRSRYWITAFIGPTFTVPSATWRSSPKGLRGS